MKSHVDVPLYSFIPHVTTVPTSQATGIIVVPMELVKALNFFILF